MSSLLTEDEVKSALLTELKKRRVMPRATYRLQFHKGFTFQDGAAIVPYLAVLGVDTLYCSPYLFARPGSMHGYDICDHQRLNPELGSEEDYQRFCATVRQHGLRQLLDIVPNHMAADPVSNPWWRDVLENGPSSRYATTFDIDWKPVKSELRGKLLLPVLEDHYGLVLERGALTLVYQDGFFLLEYGGTNFPLDPGTYGMILRKFSPALDLGCQDEPAVCELLSIATACDRLPRAHDRDLERIAERRRERESIAQRLRRLIEESAQVWAHVEHVLLEINGDSTAPRSFDSLHELLDAQPYRLAYWKTAGYEINYRRFFDINDLAGICVEREEVFEATHQKILDLLCKRQIHALRIDHIDGLFEPRGYLQRLQSHYLIRVAKELGIDASNFIELLSSLPESSPDRELLERPLVLYVEKILTGDEALRSDWPVHGTNGYDFLNEVNRLFVADDGLAKLIALHRALAPAESSFSNAVYEAKKLIMNTSLAAELRVLAESLNRISERNRRSRDFTLEVLRVTLTEVIACFPVYRTYLTGAERTADDRKMIDVAVIRALRRNPALEPSIFAFVRGVLLADRLEGEGESEFADEYQERLRFAMKLQQYTGPVHAKAVEDTVFYRYNALVSLNEVGGDPSRGGMSTEHFHELCKNRREKLPHALVGTATHDTKRGEDVRARLNVLTEIPTEWSDAVYTWMKLHSQNVASHEGELYPSLSDQYLFYQTVAGSWPVGMKTVQGDPEFETFVARMKQYLEKATKEAKLYTSWIHSDESYDSAMQNFVEGTLRGETAGLFFASLIPFVERIARIGAVNSLSQLILKMMAPGIPDLYQGTELWDLHLVDPDNRRPVDYTLRERMLGEILSQGRSPTSAQRLLADWPDGRIKLFTTAAMLALRKDYRVVFEEGSYAPVYFQGTQGHRLIGLQRQHGDQRIIAIVPHFVSTLVSSEHPFPLGERAWEDTEVDLQSLSGTGSGWRNVFTESEIPNSPKLLVATDNC